MPRASIVVALALALAACTDDVPTAPNFQTDVMPIVAANCIRCHSLPQLGGAPSACTEPATGPASCGFRLDSFEDTVTSEGDPTTTDDDQVVLGIASIAAAIPPRISSATEPMPPRFPLDDRERAILTAWAAGDPPTRLTRADNQLPTVTAAVVAGPTIAIDVDLDDADGDLVVGAVRARGPRFDQLVAPIRGGHTALTWPRPTIAGRYTLVARIDDGAGYRERELATIEVAP